MVIAAKFEGKASAEVMPSICSPGPKYNPDCANRTTRAATHVIGTGRRPPLTCPSKGPGPGTHSAVLILLVAHLFDAGAYTPFEAPQLYPPEFSFGNSPDQNRFAQNQCVLPSFETDICCFELSEKARRVSESRVNQYWCLWCCSAVRSLAADSVLLTGILETLLPSLCRHWTHQVLSTK